MKQHNKLDREAWKIDLERFAQLDPRRQHQFLAGLARSALLGYRQHEFRVRYQELIAVAQIDHYTPPNWLILPEALEEWLHFHSLLAAHPVEIPITDQLPAGISWQSHFNFTVVLDQVRSPYNVGSILRLIDNFGFNGLVHSSSWMSLNHPQLRRAARGCESWIPTRYEPDLVRFLQVADLPIVGLEIDNQAIPLSLWNPPPAGLIVVGNESYGISNAIRELCQTMVAIPLHGFKRSLNVHHALAIVAYTLTVTKRSGG